MPPTNTLSMVVAARRIGLSTATLSTLLELEQQHLATAGELSRLHRTEYRAERAHLARMVQMGLLSIDQDTRPQLYKLTEHGIDKLLELKLESIKAWRARNSFEN